jgi:hypothetical protein
LILHLLLACPKQPAPSEPPPPEARAAEFLRALSSGQTDTAAALVDPEMWLLSQGPMLGLMDYVAQENGDEEPSPRLQALLQTDPAQVQRLAVSRFPLDVEPSLRTAACRVEGQTQVFTAHSPRPEHDLVPDVRQVALVPTVCAAEIVVGSKTLGTFDRVQGVLLVQRGEPAAWQVVTLQTEKDPAFLLLRELVTLEQARAHEAAQQARVQAVFQGAVPPRFERSEPSSRPGPVANAAPGDLDGDGRSDLVLIAGGGRRAHVWTTVDASPAHTFEAPTGAMFSGHLSVDLDGDGHNELILVLLQPEAPDELWVVSGRELGAEPQRHAVHVEVSVTEQRRIVSVGDLSGDGLPDLVFPGARDTLEVWGGPALHSVSVLRGSREGGLGFSIDGWRWPDGSLTLVVGEPYLAQKHGMVWLLPEEASAGEGRLPSTFPEGELGRALAVGDFDGDDAPEVAVSAPAEGGSIVIAALTRGGLVPRLTLSHEPGERLFGGSLRAADLDGDGFDELIASGMGGQSPEGFVRVYRGAQMGLSPGRQVTLADTHGLELPGDLDGDGGADLVTTRDLFQRTGGTARIWSFPVGQEPHSRELLVP